MFSYYEWDLQTRILVTYLLINIVGKNIKQIVDAEDLFFYFSNTSNDRYNEFKFALSYFSYSI